MDKTNYIVTEKAGSYVAGKRVQHGQSMELTEAQARYELLAETVRLPDEPPHQSAVEPASKPVRSSAKGA